jgi:hypothetical protein
MTVVRQLGQAVLLLALLGCLARLLAVAISDKGVQVNQAAMVDDRPIWVWDQRGGGAVPGGDVGGDSQASEAFSVRFHHRDIPGVMVTYCYYAAVDTDDPAAISVERQTEYLVCIDPDDPGGTEVWSAYRWAVLQDGFATVQAATNAALQAAQAHQECEESWAGRPPWTPEHQEGPC